jgi:hypothetical protein
MAGACGWEEPIADFQGRRAAMKNASVTVAMACCFVLSAASCAQTRQISPVDKMCPPLLELGAIELLACWVNNNHKAEIGNASNSEIPKGTVISFTAKLENAGPHCSSVPAPRPIPAHLSITIDGQPVLDDQAPCQAWREATPVIKP